MAGKRTFKATVGDKDRSIRKRTDAVGTMLGSTNRTKPGSRTKLREALEPSANGRGPQDMPSEGVVAMEITPDLAADWLGTNLHNRKMRDPRVLRLARDIEMDRWHDLNGETIKFAPDGELLDGQHRLAAVLVANKSIWSYVAFGVAKEAFKTIDSGLKRSSVDALFVTGEDNLRTLSSACNAMFRYLSDGSFMYRDSPTTIQLLNVLQASPGLRESAAAVKKLKKRLPGVNIGVMTCIHYLLTEKDAEDAKYFFDLLSTGVGLDDDSAVYHLRERLIHPIGHARALAVGSGTQYRMAQEHGVIVLKAWNAWRQEKPLTNRSLRYFEDEKLPEIV